MSKKQRARIYFKQYELAASADTTGVYIPPTGDIPARLYTSFNIQKHEHDRRPNPTNEVRRSYYSHAIRNGRFSYDGARVYGEKRLAERPAFSFDRKKLEQSLRRNEFIHGIFQMPADTHYLHNAMPVSSAHTSRPTRTNFAAA